MGLQIIGVDERMAEKRGIKALVLGPAGVGKTSLLRTLNPERVLFMDFEAGDLAVQDVQVDQVRPKTWQECRDLACILGGFNPVLPDAAVYSEAHYKGVIDKYGDVFDKYDTFFIDSITVAARLCFKWCEQQPESISDKTGAKNLLGTYGLLGREMLGWLTQLQHARAKNVIFVCLLDKITDDFNRTHWVPQIEGSKIGRELPGIVDEVLTLQVLQGEEGATYRA
uniref:ATP-binding protein n=1 Tax=uncultured Tateyamaria sp. TaxID=455651 RepID=UPI002635B7FC